MPPLNVADAMKFDLARWHIVVAAMQIGDTVCRFSAARVILTSTTQKEIRLEPRFDRMLEKLAAIGAPLSE